MSKCFFMNTDAESTNLDRRDGRIVLNEIDCKYWIAREVEACYQGSAKLSEQQKLRCLTETIRLNRMNLIPFWVMNDSNEIIQENLRVVIKTIDSQKNIHISHKNKDLDILQMLGEKLQDNINPFSYIQITKQDRYLLSIYDKYEFIHWINHLYQLQLIDLDYEAKEYIKDIKNDLFMSELISLITKNNVIRLTVKGWQKIYDLTSTKNSRKVFVAMAFTDSLGKDVSPDLRDVIKSTLSTLEWQPHIVNEVEHNDGIMDKVITLINESHFVIAELTHQKSGVYYEAGYAKGRGLPVIHIVSKSELEKCHFDVKHLNLIVWENMPDLADKLKNRILASIGKHH